MSRQTTYTCDGCIERVDEVNTEGWAIVYPPSDEAREKILRDPIDLCPACWDAFKKAILGKTDDH